jgi:hypothetical protein
VAAPTAVRLRWPTRGSVGYYRTLLRSDLHRQKRRLGAHYQALYPDEGSEAFSLGNDFGWLVPLFSFVHFNHCFAQICTVQAYSSRLVIHKSFSSKEILLIHVVL